MAGEARIRFVLETSEARKQIDRFKRDLQDAGRGAGKLGAEAAKGLAAAVRSGAALFGGAAVSGATAALGQAGGQAGGAALAASQAVGQTLQQQGQSNLVQGIQSGSVTQVGVGLAQGALGIGEQRAIGPVRAARESGIQAAASLTQPFAAAGVDVDPSLQADIFKVAFLQAFRSIQNEAQARRASPNLAELLKLVGAEGGF